MVNRVIIECKTCKSKIAIRTQLSDEEVPINIHCGNCGISISGELYVDVKEMEMSFIYTFDNANISEEYDIEESDYYIEASGEFLTKKMVKTSTVKVADFSMFLRGHEQMGLERLSEFINKFNNFLKFSNTIWPFIRRLNELWLNKKYNLIETELKKYYPKTKFSTQGEYDSFRIIHKLNEFFLSEIIDLRIFDKAIKVVTSNIGALISSNKTEELLKMCNHFGEKSYLKNWTERIFIQYKNFVDKFNVLIPVFGLRFYEGIPEGFYETFGITTTSFENIKQFYIDLYEITLDTYLLVVAYNNLKLRGDFDLMKEKRNDVKTLSAFEKKSKGVKLSYLEDREEFDLLIIPILDNELRNALTHNSYRYDGVSQILYYYPNGNMDEKDKKQIFLLEILETCWDLFQSLILLSELIYETAKVYYTYDYANKGIKPDLETDKNLAIITEKILSDFLGG